MELLVESEQELYQEEVCMKVDLDKIEQNENSRVIYKEADLADLMHSMKKDGLLQPVGVRKIGKGRYEAVFGNRRILAAKKLGWADISVHVVDAESDTDRDILNLVENIQRKNTTLAEDGRMFTLLLDRGLKDTEIAARIGISVARVRLAIDVVKDVPKEFHRALVNNKNNTGKSTAGTVSPIVTQHLIRLRKTANLTRPQFRQLLNRARDGMTLIEAQRIAPLIKGGTSISEAFKRADKARYVQVEIIMDRKAADKWEDKNKATIQSHLVAILQKHSGFKVEKLHAAGSGAGYHAFPKDRATA